MFTKIIRKYGNVYLKHGYPCHTSGSPQRPLHNWDRQNAEHEQRRKAIPKLVYLHNPWKYLMTKFNLFKLKLLWDPKFSESEFIEGSKQAAIVMTDIIRLQSAEKISEYTTPVGFQQITRDMLLSRDDSRLQLVRFQKEHLRRAIPMKVARRQNFGRKYAFIDMLFVGLRNTRDFESPSEVVQVNEILRRMDNELKTPPHALSVPHRIVFAEIFIRFRRDYTEEARRTLEAQHRMAPPGYPFTNQLNFPFSPQAALSKGIDPQSQDPSLEPQPAQALTTGSSQNPSRAALPHTGRVLPRFDDPGWSVSFYKILTFDVLNYDPGRKGKR
ncbi:uncharacterized protein LOC117890257 [Drosophila subobscura]|uniref:uncharacterized protein LOC117890257 n=1 Tax=Drosophila subobscura TaxID=7241 RepID=UPI00155B3E37|nr:uncharacterized protein LOC117890257 [Drosophila subobscura]